jgi:hypothetical protein
MIGPNKKMAIMSVCMMVVANVMVLTNCFIIVSNKYYWSE